MPKYMSVLNKAHSIHQLINPMSYLHYLAQTGDTTDSVHKGFSQHSGKFIFMVCVLCNCYGLFKLPVAIAQGFYTAALYVLNNY